MLAKNAESSLAGLGCRLIRQPRQPINSETEFAKASQGPADEFIVRVMAAASSERKTHELISSLKHHFGVFVRRQSSILKNVTEKFMWNFIFRKYSCH